MKNLLCKSVGVAAMLAVCGAASAQITYNSTGPTAIPDNPTVSNTITVAGGTNAITGITCRINLTHTWDSDLAIMLVAPSGAYINLTSGNGGSGDNYTNTVFSDAGAAVIGSTGNNTAPFTNTYKPEGTLNGWFGTPNPPSAGTNMTTFAGFNGQNANGNWTLLIDDSAAGDTGNLIDWSITISGSIAGPTPPLGSSSATPNSVTSCGGQTSLLTVAVTPGTNPASTGITVTGDLSSISGSASQTFFDNATNGDVSAGDGIYSYLATVPNTVTPGLKSLPIVVADAEARSTNANTSITVTACPPLNDNCSGAFALASGNNPFTGMTAATTDGTASCDGSVSSNDIWFTFTSAAGGPVIFDTCSNPNGGTFFDSVLSGFSGTCGALVEEGCSDDFGGTCGTNGWASKITLTFAPGETKYIRLAAYNAASVADGTGVLTVTDVLPLVVAGNATTAQETTAALLTATVTPGTVPLSTGITVNGDLSAIGGLTNQQFYDDNTHGDLVAGDNIFSYSYTLPVSVVTGAYTIPVNAADAQLRTATSTANLTVTNGPNGACCNAGCSITRQTLCVSGGGTWQGNGTNCGGPGYAVSPAVGNAFFSIAGTGTQLATVSGCDDCTENLALPFAFNFYGTPVTTVSVSSNGNLQFDAAVPSGAFGNTTIPTVGGPENAIYPAWDDYDLGAQGDVYYQVFGTAPNRELWISWENAAEFLTTNSNNFQVRLFEGFDNFIVSYGNMDNLPEAFSGDVTVGVENAAGTSATQQASASVVENSGFEWDFSVAPDPCGPTCDGIDFNNDGLFPDTADIDDFLSVFSGGPCSNDPLCGDIDFNNDTLFPDTLDIDALLSVFSGGPCLL